MRDLWVWNDEANGNYLVKTAYKAIQIVTHVQGSEVFKKLRSLKVSSDALHFCFKTLMDRIPTMENLEKRGITLSGNLCLLCLKHLKTTNHLFLTCRVTQTVWENVIDGWVLV